jgi:hypothetical protein
MRLTIDLTDLPPVQAEERRHRPDPRTSWRGGRRNTDWTNRPIGAWRQLEQGRSPWREWIAKVPVPAFSLQRQTRP